MLDRVIIKGAREHNLRNLSLEIPRNSLTVFTGVSGSGKSSLAYDTLYKEGQRRFVQSLSAYARQFLGQIERPDVDHVEGLSPAVAIDQKTRGRNPRSTVGTVTEIFDHLRLLFARLGTPHCPECGRRIESQSAQTICRRLMQAHNGARCLILAPVVYDRKGEYRKELADLAAQGFVRVRVDGLIRRLDEQITLARYEKHTIEVVYDRITLEERYEGRLGEAVEKSLDLAEGLVSFLVGDDQDQLLTFSRLRACPDCGISIPELEPRTFSFNTNGACPRCRGLGQVSRFDEALMVPDPTLTLSQGAIAPLEEKVVMRWGRWRSRNLSQLARLARVPMDKPWSKLTQRQRKALLQGVQHKDRHYRGTVEVLESVSRRSLWPSHRRKLEQYMRINTCPDCDGTRLSAATRAVTFRNLSIADCHSMTVAESLAWFQDLALTEIERPIGQQVVSEIISRLTFLDAVGLGYLALERSAATLAGGESQRIRLASQLGSRLQGVLYILDEPSIGLHPRDNARLISTLQNLRDQGNTVFVIEHDEETICRADHIVDLGPGAGRQGGELVAQGSLSSVKRRAGSLTGKYLSGKHTIPLPASRRVRGEAAITVHKATHHNLKKITVGFPVGLFSVVTGVSGSGKSTLVEEVLHRKLASDLQNMRSKPAGAHEKITGIEQLDKVIEIDQNPIGRTPRSNPATYTKAFDHIRELYAQTPLARARGYLKGRFSFNKPGGRCETCSGAGCRVIEMQFLANVLVPCEECRGLRYNPETLEVLFKRKSIHDVLEMPVREALEFFANQPKIARILQTLDSVGMDYVRLGQPATTLSGGEAQRIKLSRELARPSTGRTLYILDEPTTGLHFADVNRLIDCLQQLVDHGNTAVVIEHNLEMIKVADHVIDLGPEGGEGGGQVVYQGDFEGFLQQRSSHTAKALREFLNPQSIPTVRKRFSRKPRAHGHSIQVRGAHKNNLKRIDVDIPHQQMTVVTGVSGSGKSSLVFDILFAEGQRRFVESLSTYARRFISRLGRASVDTVSGLAPAIAIDQKRATRNPRSTVATATEIYDYLRLLYARLGTEHCLTCDRQLTAHTPARAARDTVARWDGQRISILAPMFLPNCPSDLLLSRISDLKKLAPKLLADGYARVEIAGVVHRLDEPLPRRIPRKRPIYLVIDRVRASHKSVARLAEAFEAAYALSGRYAGVRPEGQEALHYSAHFGCTDCFYQPDQALHPRMFSFNSWEGACNHCGGLGWIRRVALERIVANPELPLLGGALTAQVADALRDIAPSVARQLRGFPLQQKLLEERPFRKLTARQRSAVWEGDPLRHRACELNAPVWPGLEGLVAEAFSHLIWGGGEPLQHFYHEASCTQCAGDRLQPRQRAVRVAGQSIAEFCRLRIDHALEFLEQEVRFRGRRARIAEQILSELTNRLTFLLDVGLSYLTLDRRAATLSGGESQRIRLATQIGNRLVGVLYCLDEPTVGLHPRDTDQLLSALERLRDLGNTIVLVEHDLETIRRADHTIDLGPGAGELGGQVVASGTPAAISRKSSSLTGRYLAGKASITRPAKRRAGNGQRLTVLGASLHNLKLDVHLPLGTLTVVSGVSGSGKSSLIIDTLVPAVDRVLRLGVPGPGPYREIHGLDQIQRMQVIDQDPIGTTPRSSPATYLGMMGPIRDLFAATRLSRAKGFTKRRFSYNVAEGQCAACQGKGAQVIEMHFLSDVWVQCVECNGQRFNKETLQVRWRGLTIADMLALSVSEALPVFENQHRIVRTLTLLDQVGLEYLRLGQGLDTLSGGEAQRVKLSAELSPTGRACPTLFVMDEPTTGLHLEDVRKLLLVLQDLVDNGHSVLVVEHHPDVIAAADWLIDLGPEAGHGGGQLVAAGAPEEVAASPASHTGRVLREILSS